MAVIQNFYQDFRRFSAPVEDELYVGSHRNLVAAPIVLHLVRIGDHSPEVVDSHEAGRREHRRIMGEPEVEPDLA